MSEKPTLLLHIGEPKTGTTSIQQFLNGYSAPDPNSGLWYIPRLEGGKAHHALAHAVRKETADEVFPRLFKPIETAKPGTVAVASSEGLSHFHPGRVLRPIPRHFYDADKWTFRVVVYLRPHISRLLSLYQQQVKTGRVTLDIDGYIRKHGAGRKADVVADRMEIYRKRTSGGLIIRPFQRDLLVGGDAVADFLDVLAPMLRTPITPPTDLIQANTSVGVARLALMRHVWSHIGQPGNPAHKAIVKKTMAALNAELGEIPPGKIVLGPEIISRLQENHLEEARFLDQQFFDKPVFEPALQNAKPGEKTTSLALEAWYTPEQRVVIKEITDAAVALLAETEQPA